MKGDSPTKTHSGTEHEKMSLRRLFGFVSVALGVAGIWWFVGTKLYTQVVIDDEQRLATAPNTDLAKAPNNEPAPEAEPAPALTWVQRNLGIRKSELPSRGVFGDMFGTASALFAALSLCGLLYTLRQQQREIHEQNRKDADQSRRDSDRHRTEQERLLIQKADQYWSPEMYDSRVQALELGERMRYALGMMNEADEKPLWEGELVYGEQILTAIVNWIVIGGSLEQNALIHTIETCFMQIEPYDTTDHAEFHRRQTAILKAITSFERLVNFYGVYASILLREQPPLTDYMGNQWSWWGPVFVPFARRCAARRAEVQRPEAFWEKWIVQYDAHYQRRLG